VSAAAAALALGAPTGALAQGGPLERVARAAGERFDAERGRALDDLSAGVARERDRLPGRAQSLSVGVTTEAPLVSERWGDVEHAAGAQLTLALGEWPALQRAALDAYGARLGAQRVAARAEAALLAQRAYLGWWRAAALRAELTEDLQAARAALAPLEGAAARGEVAELDVLDLQVEAQRLSVERARAARDEREGRAALARLVGEDALARIAPGGRAPAPAPSGEDNPWGALRGRAGAHPELALARARQQELTARAAAVEAFAPWQVALGAQAISVGLERVRGQLGVTLVVPLANPNAQEAARLSAQARAEAAGARAMAAELDRELAERAEEHEALAAELALARARLTGPLDRRQRLLEAARERGQIGWARVLAGRRDVHEARHAELELTLALAMSSAQARALASVMGQDSGGMR
jgi:outer membrane protein TolC